MAPRVPSDRTDDPAAEGLSLREVAYRRLKQSLLDRQLRSGDRVREEDIAARLQMSRTPVRDAIRRLEAEHMLVHMPLKGLCVPELDYAEMIELYDMRTVLEQTAARWAAHYISPEEIAVLRELLAREADALGDHETLAVLNRRIHSLIYAAARNRFLSKSLSMLGDSVSLLGSIAVSEEGRAHSAHAEHTVLIDAIAAKEPDAAAEAARRHLQSAKTTRIQMRAEASAAHAPRDA